MNQHEITDRMDRLDDKLDGLVSGTASTAAATTAELRAISAEVKRVGDQVESINTYLHIGNGKPAVTERISLLEREYSDVRDWCHTHDDRERSLEVSRAKERRVAKSQLLAVIVGGIFTLSASAVALLKSLLP